MTAWCRSELYNILLRLNSVSHTQTQEKEEKADLKTRLCLIRVSSALWALQKTSDATEASKEDMKGIRFSQLWSFELCLSSF